MPGLSEVPLIVPTILAASYPTKPGSRAAEARTYGPSEAEKPRCRATLDERARARVEPGFGDVRHRVRAPHVERGLGLSQASFVGHSFGGMVACEVAAASPGRATRLVLIDALGLWRDDAPIPNWMLLHQGELAGYVFRDADGEAGRRMFAAPEDPEARIMARVGLQWAMGATGKFLWPIPDKGLKKRIHRVRVPTLLVWGKEDRIVPPLYAEEFARRLGGARTEIVGQAGHAPHLEQPEAVARLVRDFLTE